MTHEETKGGYIYILTNPAFSEYVKTGYADDVPKRVAQLNSSECLPFSFQIYATYKVDTRLSDKKLHELIDLLNPDLRSVEMTSTGRKRVREFYAMTAEDAYSILEALAGIHGREKMLTRYEQTEQEKRDSETACEIESDIQPRRSRFTFTACGIEPGETVEFVENPHITAKVADDKHVIYDGKRMSLTALAKQLKGTTNSLAGPKYFSYNGTILDSMPRAGVAATEPRSLPKDKNDCCSTYALRTLEIRPH